MSASHKRQWLAGPLAERRWTAQEDEWVRTLRTSEAVERTGCTLGAVQSRRRKLGLRDGRAGRRVSMSAPGRWTPAALNICRISS